MKIQLRDRKCWFDRGFALAATLSILSLVVLVALAMLSLASITTKGSSHRLHLERARANARVALAEAMSQLQQNLGPDTRISASSGVVSDKRRHLTGVWLSHGDDLFDGETIDHTNVKTTYTKGRESRFLQWLVSGGNGDINFPDEALGGKHVTLVGKGSLGSSRSADYVNAKVLNIEDQSDLKGGYAYWVDDLGLKARVNLNKAELSGVSPVVAAAAAPSFNPSKMAQLETVDPAGDLGKAITYDTLRFLDKGVTDDGHASLFFDVTAASVGLPTSVNGGLRRDLSLAFERPGGLPDELEQHPEIFPEGPTWQDLHWYFTSYREPSEGGKIKWVSNGETEDPFLFMGDTEDEVKAKPQWNRFMPRCTKQVVVLSVGTKKIESTGKYRLRLIFDTIMEFWNPYNVALLPPKECHMDAELQAVPFGLSYLVDAFEDEDGDGNDDVLGPVPWNNTEENPYPLIFSMELMENKSVSGVGHLGEGRFTVQGLKMDFKSSVNGKIEPMRAGASYVYSVGAGKTLETAGHLELVERGFEKTGGVYTDSLWNRSIYLENWNPKTGYLEMNGQDTLTLQFKPMHDIPVFKDWPQRKFITNFRMLPNTELGFSLASERARNTLYTMAAAAKGNELGLKRLLGVNSGDKDGDGIPDHDILVELSLQAGSLESDKQPIAVITNYMRPEEVPDWSNSRIAKLKAKRFIHADPLGRRHMVFAQGDANGLGDTSHTDTINLVSGDYAYDWRPFTDWADVISINNDVSANKELNAGFNGTSFDKEFGSLNVTMKEIPLFPMTSMAQLQHADLGELVLKDRRLEPMGDQWEFHHRCFPYVNNALGNSFAHPIIDIEKIETDILTQNRATNYSATVAPTWQTKYYDKSWILNQRLWDDFFFSSVSSQAERFFGEDKDVEEVLLDALTGEGGLTNNRYIFASSLQELGAQDEVDEMLLDDGYRRVAKHLVSVGDFNVNSVSVNAWKAFLGGLDSETLAYFDPLTSTLNSKQGEIRVSRYIVPNFEPARESNNVDAEWLQKRWGGSREITDQQLTDLAEAVVSEVKERGPFLSIAEFVNRRLEDDRNQGLNNGMKGALQEAIDKTDINDSFKVTGTQIEMADVLPMQSKLPTDTGYRNLEAATGYTGEGAPGYVTQADLLMPLAPYLKVRSDTFKVRAYGESKDADGVVVATAYCEAIVQRSMGYVDGSNASDTEVRTIDGKNTDALSAQNQRYGRRFHLVSFKWLTNNEI